MTTAASGISARSAAPVRPRASTWGRSIGGGQARCAGARPEISWRNARSQVGRDTSSWKPRRTNPSCNDKESPRMSPPVTSPRPTTGASPNACSAARSGIDPAWIASAASPVDSHYQHANRLSAAETLASCGLPVILLYLGFTGDTYFRDYLRDEGHWQRVMGASLDDVVPLSWPGTTTLHGPSGGSVTLLIPSVPAAEVSTRASGGHNREGARRDRPLRCVDTGSSCLSARNVRSGPVRGDPWCLEGRPTPRSGALRIYDSRAATAMVD